RSEFSSAWEDLRSDSTPTQIRLPLYSHLPSPLKLETTFSNSSLPLILTSPTALFSPIHILARIRIHPNLLPRPHELRHIDHHSIVQLRGLRARRLRRRFHHGRRVHHLEHEELRQLD